MTDADDIESAVNQIAALKAELARRRDMEQLLFSRSASFARVGVAGVDEAVADALARLATFLRLDGVALVRLHNKDMSVVQEWNQPGRVPMSRAPELAPAQVESILAALDQTQLVAVRNIDDLPDGGTHVRDWFSARGVVGVIAVALVVGDRIAGAVVGERDQLGDDWADDDVRVMQAVGEMIIGTIERLEAESHLRQLAMSDRLTGVLNRAGVMQVLRELANSEVDHGLCVVFVDLDGFKLVNDAYGHKMGDQVLEAVAGRIVGAVRPNDVVGRIGGDEFLVVCQGINSAEAATRVCERIKSAFVEPIARIGNNAIDVGASVGAALISQGADADDAVDRADHAMYEAKRSGASQANVIDLRV